MPEGMEWQPALRPFLAAYALLSVGSLAQEPVVSAREVALPGGSRARSDNPRSLPGCSAITTAATVRAVVDL